jgi:uncharacterized membrane-anchored protein
MFRFVMVFLATWAVVFFGLSYFWHTSRAEKLNMVKMGLYSFMTAFITLVCLTAIVVLF